MNPRRHRATGPSSPAYATALALAAVAARLHVIGDLVSSFAAVVAGAVIRLWRNFRPGARKFLK
ncbi:MAG: hypothetical protein HYU76_10695 [Betaproteobacteria bacterium]|nr:hypothetical protein [Betaproteobacteria bacterium]